MRDKSRLMRIILILATLALVASACTSGGETEETSPQGTAQDNGGTPAPDTPVELSFKVWSYSIDTILDNIAEFEEANPNITVNLTDVPWPDYPAVIASDFSVGNPPDVLYSSDHWLNEWVSAGWLAPLSEYCPSFTDYVPEWAPYATQGMKVGADLYGLPYYADLVTFLYNQEMVSGAGFDQPPATLDELEEQALALQAQGVASPILIPFIKDSPWTLELFYSLVYAQGGAMFDEDMNPVFNEPGSEAEEVLAWLNKALNETKILDPVSLESREADVVSVMGAGNAVFTVLAKYNLAELNLGDHAEKGNFSLGLMPGVTQSTVGFVRFYALSQAAVDRGPEVVDAACKFLEFNGGKTDGEYVVVERWAIDKGLGFANLPLYDNTEIAESINAWGNVELERSQAVIAQAKQGLTPWWGTWDIWAREQLGLALLGDVTPAEALQNMADRWEQLEEQFS